MTKNILIIDDNPDDLEFYSDLLKQTKEKYTIFTSENVNEAEELFAKHNIYCAFIDYNLPEMNGLKVLEKLAQKAKGKKLPVVILTGEPNQTIRAEAARAGAFDFIVKDATNTPEQIEAIIKKTVDWAADLSKEQSSLT